MHGGTCERLHPSGQGRWCLVSASLHQGSQRVLVPLRQENILILRRVFTKGSVMYQRGRQIMLTGVIKNIHLRLIGKLYPEATGSMLSEVIKNFHVGVREAWSGRTRENSGF